MKRYNEALATLDTITLHQSERMRNLINDLNLASKLEYNMQPVNPVSYTHLPEI